MGEEGRPDRLAGVVHCREADDRQHAENQRILGDTLTEISSWPPGHLNLLDNQPNGNVPNENVTDVLGIFTVNNANTPYLF